MLMFNIITADQKHAFYHLMFVFAVQLNKHIKNSATSYSTVESRIIGHILTKLNIISLTKVVVFARLLYWVALYCTVVAVFVSIYARALNAHMTCNVAVVAAFVSALQLDLHEV